MVNETDWQINCNQGINHRHRWSINWWMQIAFSSPLKFIPIIFSFCCHTLQNLRHISGIPLYDPFTLQFKDITVSNFIHLLYAIVNLNLPMYQNCSKFVFKMCNLVDFVLILPPSFTKVSVVLSIAFIRMGHLHLSLLFILLFIAILECKFFPPNLFSHWISQKKKM